MQYLLIDSRPDLSRLFRYIADAKSLFMKFLSANDLGLTGAHQAGIYLQKDSWPMFITEEGKIGENISKDITLNWEEMQTEVSFKWYGSGTRSEYRLTRTGEYFRDREEHYTGSLLVICRSKEDEYFSWALNHEEDIDDVLNFTGIAPSEANGLVHFDLEEKIIPGAEQLLDKFGMNFPDTYSVSRKTWEIYDILYRQNQPDPDRMIVELIAMEYAIFRYIEKKIYSPLLHRKFSSVEDLLAVSLEVNNRRKSRAGKSLEHHLRFIFERNGLEFSHQETSEMDKRPDFIFPGSEAYRNPDFPGDRLFVLGAKTTCKDRWRQVINEADRVKTKYIFTLQQGFTTAQLHEMKSSDVVMIIPEEYHGRCRKEDRSMLMTLSEFIAMVVRANGIQERLFP